MSTPQEAERLKDCVAWLKGMTLIPQNAEIREASLSYVKPSEYRAHAENLVDQLAATLAAPGSLTEAKLLLAEAALVAKEADCAWVEAADAGMDTEPFIKLYYEASDRVVAALDAVRDHPDYKKGA